MFLLIDTLTKTTAEFNDIKDMMDVVNSAWLHDDNEAKRISEIVGRMKLGESFECRRYKIRCIDETLFIKKIWLDSSPAPSGFYRADTVNKAKNAILHMKSLDCNVEMIVIGDEISYERSFDGGFIEDFFKWCEETKVAIPYEFKEGYKGHKLVRTGYVAYPKRPLINSPYYAKTADESSVGYTGSQQKWSIYHNVSGEKVAEVEGDFCSIVNRLIALNEF